jgi:hypothetical protein
MVEAGKSMSENTRRGKKMNQKKNYQAFQEWMKNKRIGRPKQRWISYILEEDGKSGGFWEKV